MTYDNINEKSFVDVPSSVPAVKIPLQKVGINNRPHYIRVNDPFDGSPREILAEIKVTFALPAEQRGLHMSRIEEAMLALVDAGPEDLERYSKSLAAKVIESQKLNICEVDFIADYEKFTDKNKSGRRASELLKVFGKSVVNGANESHTIGIKVPFINACPCTQRWAMREYYNTLKEQGRPEADIAALLESAPKQAHTNRGVASLSVESDQVSISDLYSVLDSSVPIIRELLKGMDEHGVVRETHRQGMFCEDNIRAILDNTLKRFSGKLPGSTKIHVSVEVDESVHHHNLISEMSETLEGISALRK